MFSFLSLFNGSSLFAPFMAGTDMVSWEGK